MSTVSTKWSSAGSRGFSLVEILIVIAIILALMVIAIPRMVSARMKANEASAMASMRAIRQAEDMYRDVYPEVGYSGNLADLGSHGSNCDPAGKTNSCLIMDTLLTGGMKSGYMFEVLGDGNAPTLGYTLTATPESMGNTGRCIFVSDQTGAINLQGGNHSRLASAASVSGNCEGSI